MGLVGDGCDDAIGSGSSSPKSPEELGVGVCVRSYKVAVGRDDGELDDIVDACFRTSINKDDVVRVMRGLPSPYRGAKAL